MLYCGDGEGIALALIVTDDEDDADLTQIKTECNVVISPVSRAEVIVYGPDGSRQVFEASYGALPNLTLVIAVRDSHGAFAPDDEDGGFDARVIFDPYGDEDDHVVVTTRFLPAVDGCPICNDDPPAPESTDGPPAPESTDGPINRLDFYFGKDE